MKAWYKYLDHNNKIVYYLKKYFNLTSIGLYLFTRYFYQMYKLLLKYINNSSDN